MNNLKEIMANLIARGLHTAYDAYADLICATGKEEEVAELCKSLNAEGYACDNDVLVAFNGIRLITDKPVTSVCIPVDKISKESLRGYLKLSTDAAETLLK